MNHRQTNHRSLQPSRELRSRCNPAARVVIRKARCRGCTQPTVNNRSNSAIRTTVDGESPAGAAPAPDDLRAGPEPTHKISFLRPGRATAKNQFLDELLA